MKKELDSKLCETYPYMFRERHMSMTQTCMCWGFECGDGWYNIISALCSGIENHVNWKRKQRAQELQFNRALRRAIEAKDVGLMLKPKYKDQKWHIEQCQCAFDKREFKELTPKVERVVVEQVKEKFGTLRFYYRGGDDVVFGMVYMAESMSALTCEKCGEPGKSSSDGGWVTTLCDKHRKERNKQKNTQ